MSTVTVVIATQYEATHSYFHSHTTSVNPVTQCSSEGCRWQFVLSITKFATMDRRSVHLVSLQESPTWSCWLSNKCLSQVIGIISIGILLKQL